MEATTEEYKDLEYKSKVTDDVLVVGTENAEKYQATVSAARERGRKVICTHSDAFHCDEVLASVLLLYTNAYKDSIIVRTRDQAIIDTLDIVCDVGGVYNPPTNRFDHHQKSFTDVWNASKPKYVPIRLSSAGLIYKHFGKEVLANAVKDVWNQEYSEETLDRLYLRFYDSLILEVDAIDNGVSEAEDMRWHMKTGLASRVGRLNSPWNAPPSCNQHAQFKKAMKIAEEEFLQQLRGLTQYLMPAFDIVKKAWDQREQFHESKQILFFEKMCPWKEHLFSIEEELQMPAEIKFVMFVDGRGMWRISTVPPHASSFDMRVPLCKEWRGLRKDEISKIEGNPLQDIEFVHNTGFCGGAWSKDTAIKMALASIQQHAELAKKND